MGDVRRKCGKDSVVAFYLAKRLNLCLPSIICKAFSEEDIM